MTDYHWPDLRLQAINAFGGEVPQSALEDEILVTFERQPQLVAKAIDQVAAQFAKGDVQSGWAVLRHRVVALSRPRATTTASDTSDRERKTAQAEQWMRAAGLHVPTEDDTLDEIFGDRGLLNAWHNDETLRQRMLRLWREQRPIGEQLDAELEQRMEHWKQTTGVMIGLVDPPLALDYDP